MFSPFKYVKCIISHSGDKVITWCFNKNLTWKQTPRLFVEYSTTGDQWQTLSYDVFPQFYFIDDRRTSFDKLDVSYYRLRLLIGQTQCYISQTCPAGASLSYPHYPRAKNLVRLASKQINKTGRPGVFLKRKNAGQPCPRCKDFSDDVSVNQHCSTCLGTGIVGGYYQGIPMSVLPESVNTITALNQTGIDQSIGIKARCVAWPYIQHGDVWVDSYNNQRYYIDQVTTASYYKHVPLMYIITMNLIEQTDVIHSDKADQLTKPNVDWMQEFKVY